MYNERNLLESLAKGDRQAYNLLYLMYAPKVEVFVEKLVKNKETAEDITHNVFLQVWEKKDIISKVNSFNQYVFKMARNSVFDLFDHNLIKMRYKKSIESKGSFSVLRTESEEEIHTKDLSMLIDLTINRMPPKRKIVFLMSRKEGLSHKEIAEKLNISTRTVENHLAQAREEIRRVIS
ncbi:RNA polymerase sigma-70 factor [Mangrovibacterium diazotrophicum]|uniref:RNA polymerase sigma-70 factor (ECF subfamily) n=1 Tax=Mangrovibacterium diazotrophicum TaxID=1261403 RepID=A0A419W607_9BACT|nr:RNA polymerase sigma-70 factor [Mangrovibacterium diazotrophicum]RKD90898.1 RNA polymerase sigma-70 factor (ECF subfamily) [Mangrovibacterium diazotrophicum]